jgi:UDP:flavonoid glycosyltransferase YjiC (YdhE family)
MAGATQDAGPAARRAATGRRVVLATLGSLGDLHPFIAVAKELQARGHEPVIATSEFHRERVERQGIAFFPMRPDLLGLEDQPDLFRKLMDRKTGTEFIFKQIFMPNLRDSYDDLREAVRGADLLVSHTTAFAGPLLAEVTGVRWVSAVLSPASLMSKYDPPVPPQAPWLRHLHPLGPWFFGALLRLGKHWLRPWTEPVRRLREELGLPRGGDPMFEGANSPECVLALFSEVIGTRQPDWPPQAVQTGFAFFDDAFAAGLSPELAQFLDAGPPPIVFTLGSSAVMDAGPFYEESVEAVRRLGRRAVVLLGIDPRNRPAGPLPQSVIALDYVPFSALFPRAAAIVHQGGVGTTAQALRAGRPMLVVPWSHDQPDNAERVRRLGVARTLDRNRYHARTAAAALDRLLDDSSYVAQADAVGRRVRREHGTAAACDAIERSLATPRASA